MDSLRRFFVDDEEDRPADVRPAQGGASGKEAMSRLKIVLAHDRAGLDEETMAKIRAEISAVVSKYVQLDESNIDFNLMNDDRNLVLFTASFPLIKRRSAVAAAASADA